LQSGATGHPFVAPGAYRQPCRAVGPLGCDKDMATSQQLRPPAPPLGHYDIDISRSVITFSTRHLFGLGPVRGSFGLRSGSLHLTEPLAESEIRAEIDTASFHTGNPIRDRRVRSAAFLDARRWPEISFTDGRISPDGASITGTLTVRDQARPVTLTLSALEADGQSFTAGATIRIDRNYFGVTASPGLAGRYLDLELQVRCVRKSSSGGFAHV
jgi:polyisoprenoid-binding protein YceI